MIQIELTESRAQTIHLRQDQARALTQLGASLRGSATWWGAPDEPETRTGSPVSVEPAGDGEWRVVVRDAIGLLAIPDATLVVQPKIPLAHVLPLLVLAGLLPRASNTSADFTRGGSLWQVLGDWYIREIENVLRRDLMLDYRQVVSTTTAVRGRVLATATAQRILSGRAEAVCEFDEFDRDTALNRVLLEALRQLLLQGRTDERLRPRLRRLIASFGGVTRMRPGDLGVEIDRRTSAAGNALHLARLILWALAPDLRTGPERGWAFLLRTPEAVEKGVRTLLTSTLGPEHDVRKRGLRLQTTAHTLNPDLVFDAGATVGDVKYKIGLRDWSRDDLYQVVAFATGFRARSALLVSFDRDAARLPPLVIGDVTVGHVAWRSHPDIAFEEAALAFSTNVSQWLDDRAL